MTEPAQPLSRRERRAMEEAARAAEGDETQALPVTPETLSVVSRRERRRMERLANPMETWTAEEEMIATGQMPAMTPEVIAEQERLARERAAQADAEARAAFAETAPAESQEPAEFAEATSTEAEPVAETSDAPVEQPVYEPEPAATEPDESGIPEGLRHLFPPGSLQARTFAAEQTAAPAVTAANPDAIDEIRRLTHEAMAGISRATTDPVPAVSEEQAADEGALAPVNDEVVEEAEPQAEVEAVAPVAAAAGSAWDAADDVPAMPEGVDVEELWNAPTVDEPVRESVLNRQDAQPEPDPVSLEDVPFVEDVPVPTEPTAGDTVGGAPIWGSLVPAVPSAHPRQVAADAAVAQPEAAPTIWDNHPLMNPGASPVRELPAEPAASNLPRPDLTALLGDQQAPTVEPTPYVSTEPLTTTGTMPARVSEPHPGGGARHFRWVHLAVIGAIAFMLGVLAWNIARSG